MMIGGGMPKEERNLLQVRVTEEEKRRIKTLAASQGMTLQEALVEAFDAWEKALKASGGASKSRAPKPAGKKR
jgi:hypothetical protein